MKTEIIGIQDQQSPQRTSRRASIAQGTSRRAKEDSGADPIRVYSKIVERYAMMFDRPETRLRFLNNTLAKQSQRHQEFKESLSRFRFLERTPFYDKLLEARLYGAILEELKALSPSASGSSTKLRERMSKVEVPATARLFLFVYHARHAFYALGLVMTGLLLFGCYSFAMWSARHVNTILAQRYQKPRSPQMVLSPAGQGTALAGTNAKLLPDYSSGKIWMVEKSGTLERYSNSSRIHTEYETENHQRGYYLIPRGSDTDGDQLRRDPVGIVYHTSESDIIPFEQNNNLSIKQRSQWLLDYVRKNKSYNYLIDRYGEVYRVVRDDHAAHHAGHSIWADDKYTYIGLNESFIGICFESTSEAETTEDTLTEAQLYAGRLLTGVLRYKYGIQDANCTTHGLVSVNPDKMLIAYHHDWVRNFPFAAMGLSDKYEIQPPNALDYGFNCDNETFDKLGQKLWPGAVAAEEEFKKRAERLRINSDLLRRKLRDRYLAQIDKARRLKNQQDDNGKTSLASQSSITSSSAER